MNRIRISIICAVMAVIGMAVTSSQAEAKTKKPLLVMGEPCATGSARQYPWRVFEDSDGDGTYDMETVANCDGSTVTGPLNSVNPIQIGQLPTGPTVMFVSISYTAPTSDNGMWDWELNEYAGSTSPVCTVARLEGILSCSCQGDGGQLQ